MRRRIVATIVALTGTLALLLAGSPAAQAAKPPEKSAGDAAVAASTTTPYLAIGDSYAAGTGLTPYSSTSCFRSATQAYPTIVATELGYTLTFLACTAATTATLPGQYASVSAPVGTVTITIGGNDIGFSAILSDCVDSLITDGCSTSRKNTTASLLAALPAKITAAVDAVQAAYPDARVLVTGYPVMFGDNLRRACVVGSYLGLPLWINPGDATYLNSVAVQLNAAIRSGTEAAGGQYVDVASAFDTHGQCDSSTAWVAGIKMASWSRASESSFHPTATGQRNGYAAPVKQAMGVATTLNG